MTMLFPLPPLRVTLLDDPQRDPQETAFLQSILEDPDEDARRLIFADWLEENAQADKAAFVRLEVELSRLPRRDDRFEALREELSGLSGEIGWRWVLALLRPGRLLNCGLANLDPDKAGIPRNLSAKATFAVRFEFPCPNRWADLQPTGEAGVRYCAECQKNVHYCASQDEAEQHAIRGNCIAISSRLALQVEDERAGPPIDPDENQDCPENLVLGEPTEPRPYELWAREMYRRHHKRWWQFWR
jgi:uncharacterized protein (TIGR02996 family)